MRTKLLHATLLGIFTIVTAAACASAGAGGATQPASSTDPDLLTQTEIEGAGVGNLYDVVSRLRPRWLSARGGSNFQGGGGGIVVYQNQTRLGGPEVLRQINAGMAVRMRFLEGNVASNTLPGLSSTSVYGAIVIETAVGRG